MGLLKISFKIVSSLLSKVIKDLSTHLITLFEEKQIDNVGIAQLLHYQIKASYEHHSHGLEINRDTQKSD